VPFRLTAVFRREANGWKIIQQHLSIGIRNEEVVGKELMT
jgi:ketosteroid isomerase-like protein